MISIPLAPIAAFLGKHGALGVLEGAPITGPARDPLFLSALSRASLAEMAGPCNLRGSHLYLGTDAVCPAAVGWASRVLAVARGWGADRVPLLNTLRLDEVGLECYLPYERIHLDGEGVWWVWNAETYEELIRPIGFFGPPPPTPAGRVAAVLRYELERA